MHQPASARGPRLPCSWCASECRKVSWWRARLKPSIGPVRLTPSDCAYAAAAAQAQRGDHQAIVAMAAVAASSALAGWKSYWDSNEEIRKVSGKHNAPAWRHLPARSVRHVTLRPIAQSWPERVSVSDSFFRRSSPTRMASTHPHRGGPVFPKPLILLREMFQCRIDKCATCAC